MFHGVGTTIVVVICTICDTHTNGIGMLIGLMVDSWIWCQVELSQQTSQDVMISDARCSDPDFFLDSSRDCDRLPPKNRWGGC